jgi:hypothetical protein
MTCAVLTLLMKMFPKLSEAGLIPTGALPVPERARVSGLLGSLLVMTIDACSRLVMDGVKVEEMVQKAPGAKVAPQPFESVKSAAFGPEGVLTVMLESVAVPVFVSVALSAELVFPTGIPLKTKEEGFKVAAGTSETIIALTCEELALVPAELKASTTK